MFRFLSILIACCLQIALQASGQTNPPSGSPPPPPLDESQTWEEWEASQTNTIQLDGEPYYITMESVTNSLGEITDFVTVTNHVNVYPFVLCYGPGDLRAPPAWMLAGPPKADPYYSLKIMGQLDGEAVEIEIRITGDQAFFQGGLEMGTELILNGLNDKFIAQVPHTNSQPAAVTIPESIVVSGAGSTRWNDVFIYAGEKYGFPAWTKDGVLGGPRETIRIWIDGGGWTMANPFGGEDYRWVGDSPVPPKTGWVVADGDPEAPTLNY